MENNENFAAQAENVEQTTEQTKTFSQADVDRMVKEKLDEVLPGKLARKEAKIRKEYESKYGNLETVLKAGTGKESVDELTDTFSKFYESKGIKINKPPALSAKDTEVLARAAADEIIKAGFDEVVEEVDRLTEIGVDKMTARDKAMFRVLAEHRQNTERAREYASMGVGEDVYNSQEFKDFAGKFTSKTPVKEIYDIYSKTQQPKKEIKPMGSVKGSKSTDGVVKEFYTYEEAVRFTREDYAKNPGLLKAVEASAKKW